MENQEPGSGVNYEVVVSALIALRLCTDANVLNFELQTNKNPGENKSSKFDDVTLIIETNNGKLYFAIQLKLGENDDKKLTCENFVAKKKTQEEKGNFLLSMYCKSSFCDRGIDCQEAKCVTPDTCDIIHCEAGTDCKLPHRRIKKILRKKNEFYYILYTNKEFDPNKTKEDFEFKMTTYQNCKGKTYFSTEGEIYKFEVKDSTKGTEHVMKEDYSMFFENFSLYVGQKNDKEIEKEIEDVFEKEFGVRQQAANYINFFRRCHDNVYSDRKINKEIVRIQLLELLLPEKKLALKRDLEFFEEMIKKVNITIINEEYLSVSQNYCIDWKDKFYVLKGKMSDVLKEGKKKKLIENSVNGKSLSAESAIRTLLYHYEYPIIIRYENSKIVQKAIKSWGLDNKLHFVLVGGNVTTVFPDATTIFRNLSDHKLSDDLYNALEIGLRRNKYIFLTELISNSDDASLQEYISVADMLQMYTRRYHFPEIIGSGGDYYPRQIKPNVSDSEIPKYFNTENYLLLGDAGSGKTELLKYLSTNWSSEDSSEDYTVYVNLKEKQSSPNACVNSFLDIDSSRVSLLSKLKEILRDKKRIIFFFDALDEVFDKSETLDCLKQIKVDGFKFWVAARSCIQKDLQLKLLDVRCLEIEDFAVDTQNMYIAWKMGNSVYDDTASNVIEKIRTIRETRQVNAHLVALPFYLNMLIDIYGKSQGGEHLELREKFVVTDLYRSFTDGSFSRVLKKQELILKDFPALDFLKYYFWQQYEKIAIESCFGSVLSIRHSDDSYYKIFVKYIEDMKEDPLGIVCKRDDGFLEFIHRNYAEYFVALWIFKNFHFVHNLKNVIGGEQNANIRYFLDLELTERDSIFLAVLHKDVERVKENVGELHKLEDRSRRNVLHLACSQMPGPDEEIIVEEILKRIENPRRLNKPDELCRLTPVEYCEFFNFPTYAAVLRRYGFSLSEKMIYNILDYAISKNSPLHLQELMEDENGELQLQLQNYMKANQSSLLKSVCNNYVDVVHILLRAEVGLEFEDDMGKTSLYYSIVKGYDEMFVSLIAAGVENYCFKNNFTTLQLSVACGRLEMCIYLVNTCGISINDSKNGFAALHIAILNHRTELLKFLVNELNASVNASCQFEANLRETDHIAREILGPRWDRIKCDEPRSALDLALDCGYLDCVEFLVQKNAEKMKYRLHDIRLEAIF